MAVGSSKLPAQSPVQMPRFVPFKFTHLTTALEGGSEFSATGLWEEARVEPTSGDGCLFPWVSRGAHGNPARSSSHCSAQAMGRVSSSEESALWVSWGCGGAGALGLHPRVGEGLWWMWVLLACPPWGVARKTEAWAWWRKEVQLLEVQLIFL